MILSRAQEPPMEEEHLLRWTPNISFNVYFRLLGVEIK